MENLQLAESIFDISEIRKHAESEDSHMLMIAKKLLIETFVKTFQIFLNLIMLISNEWRVFILTTFARI